MARKGKSGASSGSAELTMDVDSSAVDEAAKNFRRAIDDQVADALRRLGDEVVGEARRKVRAGPSAGKYGTHSREDTARGIGFDVKSGRLVLESDPRLPSEHRGFPAFYGLSRWAHPVFGGRTKVSQRGAGPFWDPKSYEKRAEQLLTEAGQRAADKVD